MIGVGKDICLISVSYCFRLSQGVGEAFDLYRAWNMPLLRYTVLKREMGFMKAGSGKVSPQLLSGSFIVL
jgi:hypothetical protein